MECIHINMSLFQQKSFDFVLHKTGKENRYHRLVIINQNKCHALVRTISIAVCHFLLSKKIMQSNSWHYSSGIPKFQNYIKPIYTAINISKSLAILVTLVLYLDFNTAQAFYFYFSYGYRANHWSKSTILSLLTQQRCLNTPLCQPCCHCYNLHSLTEFSNLLKSKTTLMICTPPFCT